MNNESKDIFFHYKKLAERLAASEQENKRLINLICDLRKENESVKSELRNQSATRIDMQSGASGECNEYKKRCEELVKINHGWKKEYEELQMRYEMLNYEKKQLEEEGNILRGQINELMRRQSFSESEIAARQADALSAQELSNNGANLSEEQCEILKCQMIVYKEDFELERKDRETLQVEMAKYQQKLEDMEEIIKELTTELDARNTLYKTAREMDGRTERAYPYRNGDTPLYPVRMIHPYHPADEIYQFEEDSGILSRYCQQMSVFYGGIMKAGYPEEL